MISYCSREFDLDWTDFYESLLKNAEVVRLQVDNKVSDNAGF